MVTTGNGSSMSGPARARRPRGMAMLLVLITLVVAVVLTGAALTSQDVSAAIGNNAAEEASAKWAAESAANFAIAVLQTQTDWIDENPTMLLDGMEIAGARISATLTDMTGEPPDEEDTELILTVFATVGSRTKVVQRLVTVQPNIPADEALDTELREFGIFAQQLNIDDTAVIAPWVGAQDPRSNTLVKLGSTGTSTGDVAIFGSAQLTRTGLYVSNVASAGLKAYVNDAKFCAGDVLPFTIPMAPKRVGTLFTGLPLRALTTRRYDTSGGATTISSSGQYADVIIDNAHTMTLDASGGPISIATSDLIVDDASALVIVGDVFLKVGDDLEITDDSTIELAEGATLTIFCRDYILVRSSGLGVSREVAADDNRSIADIPPGTNPGRLRVYFLDPLDGGTGANVIAIDDQSLAVAVIHGPAAQGAVVDGSTLLGRFTGFRFSVVTNSKFFYDTRMDRLCGFTARNGPLYNADGTPIPGLADTLGSFTVSNGCDALYSAIVAAIEANAGEDALADGTSQSKRSKDHAKSKKILLSIGSIEGQSLGSVIGIPDEQALVLAANQEETLGAADDDDELLDDLGSIVEDLIP